MRIELWVTREEPELRLVEGDVKAQLVDGFHVYEARVARVTPADDLSSAERQEAEDRLLEANHLREKDAMRRARLSARLPPGVAAFVDGWSR